MGVFFEHCQTIVQCLIESEKTYGAKSVYSCAQIWAESVLTYVDGSQNMRIIVYEKLDLEMCVKILKVKDDEPQM